MNGTIQSESYAEYYFGLLQNINAASKRALIAQRSRSLEVPQKEVPSLKSLFGAYKTEESVDEIIAAIRASRVSNRTPVKKCSAGKNTARNTKYELKMILDTGATNTTIDSSALYLLGYDLKDTIGSVEIETANGIIETEVFELETFASLGLVKKCFPVQVYDFLAHGIFTDYNGLVGLDFLEGTKFCIDMKGNTLELTGR